MKASLPNISPESRCAVLLAAGISIFGFSDNLTMLVSEDVGVGQFHFSRSLFAIFIVAILGKLLGLSVIPRLWKPVLIRTLFMVIAIFLYFSVMPMMAIAEAGAGLFTSPIFVLLLSAILFRERIGWRRTSAVVMASFGVLLILRPGSDGFSPYHLIPVLSGASYAFGSIITFRYLSDESPLAILMSFIVAIGLCGGAFATGLTVLPVSQELIAQAPFLFRGWQVVDVWFWVWMAVIAMGACMALSMMTRAYQIAQTSYAAIYEYAYLISLGFFSWAFWGVVPGIFSIAGIVLIIFAGILIVLAQHRKGKSVS